MRPKSPLPYQPHLDGLRAAAVALVIVYHARVTVGGYLGVDIFFVLSGYLITQVLLREGARTGRISVVKFYVRRALRLLPALYVLQITFLIFAFAGIVDKTSAGGDVIATVLYYMNWDLVFSTTTRDIWIMPGLLPLRNNTTFCGRWC